MLSANVRELVFERIGSTDGGEAFDFVAGQWVSLVLPLPEGEARRAYSIASPPEGNARFSIAVTRVSTGTGARATKNTPKVRIGRHQSVGG